MCYLLTVFKRSRNYGSYRRLSYQRRLGNGGMSEGNKLRLTFLLYFFFTFLFILQVYIYFFLFNSSPFYSFCLDFSTRAFFFFFFLFFSFFFPFFMSCLEKKERSDELRCHSSLTYHFRNTMGGRSGTVEVEVEVDGWMGDSVSWLVGWDWG